MSDDRVRVACEVLGPSLGGRVRRDVTVATTMRVGGLAALGVEVFSTEEAAQVLITLEGLGIGVAPLGLGSNVIVPDTGFGGAVLLMGGPLRLPTPEVQEVSATEALVTFGAGVPNAHAVKALHSRGWIGAECVALVPGSLGGAVAMNAGTKHGEIAAVLDAVEVAYPDGCVGWLSKDDLSMAYRVANLPAGSVVGRVQLKVQRGDTEEGKAQVQQEKAYRKATQPFKLATSGSIFRNPPGDYAGRLIEACGLKGALRGEAVISDLHANWIVNQGGAKAADVIGLIDQARLKVWERFGVALHPEVRLLSGRWDEILTPLG